MKLSQRGMSLLEIMLAGALLAALAVVGMHFSKQMVTAGKTAEVSTEQFLVHNEIIGVLSDPDNCKASFNLRPFNTANSISEIKDKNNIVRFNTVRALGQGKIKINSMRLVKRDDTNSAGEGKSDFFIEYNLGRSAQRQFVSKSISLFVKVNSDGNIVNCRSLSNDSDIWQRQASNMVNIEYRGGNVEMNILKATGDISTCNAQTKGQLTFNNSSNFYIYCDGTRLHRLSELPVCNENDILQYYKGTDNNLKWQCINLAVAECKAKGFRDYSREYLACTKNRCGAIDCNTPSAFDADRMVSCNVTGKLYGEEGETVEVDGYYEYQRNLSSDLHYHRKATYKCQNYLWTRISGEQFDSFRSVRNTVRGPTTTVVIKADVVHLPDNSSDSIQRAQALP